MPKETIEAITCPCCFSTLRLHGFVRESTLNGREKNTPDPVVLVLIEALLNSVGTVNCANNWIASVRLLECETEGLGDSQKLVLDAATKKAEEQ